MPRRAVAHAVDQLLEATVVLSFSRVGFAIRSRITRWGPPASGLIGRRVLVTGGSSGIGAATAAALAQAGASVIVTSRDEARARAAAERLATGARQVRGLAADLGDPSSVRRLAAAVIEAGPLDAVIHNAGALNRVRRVSAGGHEETVAVHVLGPHLLTTLLAGALGQANGRVITVTSGGMYSQRLDVQRLEMSPDEYDGVVAYARAKRAQVALTRGWADQLAPAGVTAHVMHPGWAATPGLRDALPRFASIAGPFLRTPDQAADTAVWLAARTPPPESGGLWLDRSRRRSHRLPWTHDPPGEARKLMAWCAAQTGSHPDGEAAPKETR